MTMVLNIRPFALVAALLAAAVTGCLSSKRGDAPLTAAEVDALSGEQLTEKRAFGWNGRVLPYRLHRPPCAEGTRYPLVLFLHGAGERGEDNVKTLVYGVVPICRYAMKHGDAFVIAPQCPPTSISVALPVTSCAAPKNVRCIFLSFHYESLA